MLHCSDTLKMHITVASTDHHSYGYASWTTDKCIYHKSSNRSQVPDTGQISNACYLLAVPVWK